MKDLFWLFGTKVSVLQSETESGDKFDLVEGLFPPGSSSPLHMHTQYSETIYLLEGKLTIFTPGSGITLSAGDTYYIPRSTPHALVNNSESEPFRALAVASPGGFAKLIRAIGIEASPDGLPPAREHDMALAAQVMEELGDKILGPPGARP